MVVIRLARRGAKKRPFYDVVAIDKRQARDGRFIEKLGFYNPIASGKAEEMRFKLDRIDYWVGQGAQLSNRMTHLIKKYKKSSQAAA